MSIVIVHLAGEYTDRVQRCVRCWLVLADDRNSNWPSRGWESGAEIAIADTPPGVLSGQIAWPDDGRECGTKIHCGARA